MDCIVYQFASITLLVAAVLLAVKLHRLRAACRALQTAEEVFLVEVDRSNVIRSVNGALCRKLGCDEHDLVGQPLERVIPASELGSFVQDAGESPRTGLAVSADGGAWWSGTLPGFRPGSSLRIGFDAPGWLEAESSANALREEVARLRQELEARQQYLPPGGEPDPQGSSILGSSDGIRYVLHKIKQVAGTDATVLIEGETGVGKELVTRTIHEFSVRRAKPLVCVNCAALPPTLIESELFGHEKGAFTSADRTHAGRFEQAEGGTLFLDEIGELALDLQAKLLRVLQEGEYTRVGGTKTLKTNVRVIVATNIDLGHAVEEGRFRKDLYYRLSVFPISVPPLRERREDIPELVQHFVRKHAERHGRPVLEVSRAVIQSLCAYDWPGNVRELENVVERAVITSVGPALSLSDDLGSDARGRRERERPSPPTLCEMERKYIEEILRRVNGQIAGRGGAAEILGMHPNTLRGRMARLRVSREN